MRRACVILASACLLLVVGCRDYDLRLGKTLEEMKYQQRLEREPGEGPDQGAASAGIDLRPSAQGPFRADPDVQSDRGRTRKIRPREQLYRPGEASEPSCPGPPQEAQGPSQERSRAGRGRCSSRRLHRRGDRAGQGRLRRQRAHSREVQARDQDTRCERTSIKRRSWIWRPRRCRSTSMATRTALTTWL